MTRPERGSADADRLHSSSHRAADDRDDTGAQHTTGSHRVADDVTDAYPEVPPRGADHRLSGPVDAADPRPRRRRGAPPTLGLAPPPPPITKELVSEDAPRPSGFVAPIDPLSAPRPASASTGSFGGGRPSRDEQGGHVSDRLTDTGRHERQASGRHGSDDGRHVVEEHTGGHQATGAHARADRMGDLPDRGADGRATSESGGRFAGLRGLRPIGGRFGARDDDGSEQRRQWGSRRSADRGMDDPTTGRPDRDGTSRIDLRGFRAGASRIAGGRLGDALRPRNAPTDAGPRQRFGDPADDGAPSDAPNGPNPRRRFGAAPSSDAVRPDAPTSGGGRGAAPTSGGGRPATPTSGAGRERNSTGDWVGRSGATAPLPLQQPRDGGPRATGPVGAPVGRGRPPRRTPGGGPSGARPPAAMPPGSLPPSALPPGAVPPGAVPPGAMPPVSPPPGAMPAAGPMRPGGGPSGAVRPGGGPSGAIRPTGPVRPGGGPSGAVPPAGMPGPAGPISPGPIPPAPLAP
ncbi:MAG TPA: hypothetical protein VH442_15050, partial [Micromonosporaceae bacterium]